MTEYIIEQKIIVRPGDRLSSSDVCVVITKEEYEEIKVAVRAYKNKKEASRLKHIREVEAEAARGIIRNQSTGRPPKAAQVPMVFRFP